MKRVLHTPDDREEIYQRFMAYLDEWKVRLVLREWSITLHLDTKDFKQEGAKSGAFTEATPKYHDALISLHLPDGVEWSDEEIEDTAIHELMHVLVSTWFAVWSRTHRKPLLPQMYNMLLVLEEQLCTRLALGFMRTKYPRRKAHSFSSVGGQEQVSPKDTQAPQ
jgi:hypothetical protein